jgi:hypothetical protein
MSLPRQPPTDRLKPYSTAQDPYGRPINHLRPISIYPYLLVSLLSLPFAANLLLITIFQHATAIGYSSRILQASVFVGVFPHFSLLLIFSSAE